MHCLCFGELLLRLNSIEQDRLFQSSSLEYYFGGAEANVAALLAQLEHTVNMVTVLPNNPIGEACLRYLNSFNISTSNIKIKDGRMGLYFLDAGAIHRASTITYDRQHSAFTLASPADFQWPEIAIGADLLHISGITLALSDNTWEMALNAVQHARKVGIKVSFDCNYRPSLWRGREALAIQRIKTVMAYATVVFATYKDTELLFGNTCDLGLSSVDKFKHAADTLLQHFDTITTVCATHRVVHDASSNTLTGLIRTRSDFATSREYHINGIVDRVGGGDAFAAGVLHRYLNNASSEDIINFATASAVIKHSIKGDANLTNESEINSVISAANLDVKR